METKILHKKLVEEIWQATSVATDVAGLRKRRANFGRDESLKRADETIPGLGQLRELRLEVVEAFEG